VKKFIASLLIFSLSCGQVFGGGAGNSASADESSSSALSNLRIPESIGQVDEIYVSPHPGAPWVIHIKDAHSNYAAQKNIRNLLKYLLHQYGCESVGVEGASLSVRRAQLEPTLALVADVLREPAFPPAEFE
jgi:hypothetical protein